MPVTLYVVARVPKALQDANRAIVLQSSNYLAFYRKGFVAAFMARVCPSFTQRTPMLCILWTMSVVLTCPCLCSLAALNLGELELAKDSLQTGLTLATAANKNRLVVTLEKWIDRCVAELEIDEEEDDDDDEPEVTEVETPPELPPTKAPVAPTKAPAAPEKAPAAPAGPPVQKTVHYK